MNSKAKIYKYFSMLLVIFAIIAFFVSTIHVSPVQAQLSPTPTIPWTSNVWVPDQEVTVTGKRGERARQFINWVLDHPAIDNHPVFRQIWLISSGTALFLILIVVAFMGIGVLIARKKDVSFKVDVVPILYKTAIWLLYIVFSYLIILALIQVTDVIMQFFIKILKGDQLFKIFFVSGNPTATPLEALRESEEGYITFQGYRRIGMEFEESARSSLFLINFTSFTYFVMGIMLLLRKVVLWFLLVVAPFLAILMPFVFIRNIGWIWIGVFFQWAFYGPLFALFLGAMAKIWGSGIPFAFDFTRAKQSCEPAYMAAVGPNCNEAGRVVYPLAINILYGGPAQRVGGLGSALSEGGTTINTSGYIDTFAEYVIALIMLWTVIILPWWLLRIFRDYCCDGIYAMRNILMNMLNGGGINPSPQPSPSQTREESLRRPQVISMQDKAKIKDSIIAKVPENISIKTVETAKLAQKLEVHVENLRDIARFETSKEKNQYYHELSGYMSNPMSAQSSTDRATFVRLKTEISERANRGDQLAARILAATTVTSVGMRENIRTLAQSRPAVTTVAQAIAKATVMKSDQVTHVLEAWVSELKNHTDIPSHIARNTQSTASTVQNVLNALPKIAQTANVREYIEKVSTASSTSTSIASRIMQSAASVIDKSVIDKVSKMASVSPDHVIKVLEKIRETDKSAQSNVEYTLIQETKESKETVQSALTVLSNMSTEKSFVEKVSQASTTTHEVVEKILGSLPTVAQSHIEQAMDVLSQNANTTKDTVAQVLESISTVLNDSRQTANQLQTIANTVGVDNKTIAQFITTVERYVSQLQEQTSSLSALLTSQNITEKNQRELFTAFSSFSDAQIEKLVHEKDTTLEKAHAVIQSIGQHIAEPAHAMFEMVAKEQGVTAQTVQSLSTAVFSHMQNSVQTARDIQTQSAATQVSADKLQAVAQVLSSIQNKQNIAGTSQIQQSASDHEQATKSMQEVVRLITSSDRAIDNVMRSTNTTHEQVAHVLSQIPAVVAQSSSQELTSQLSQQSKVDSSIVEKILTSLAKEVEKEDSTYSLIEEIAHQTSMTETTIASVLNNFAKAMSSSVPAPLATALATQMQVPHENTIPLLQAVSQVALSQQDLIGQVAQSAHTSKEIVASVLSEVLSTKATDSSASLLSRISDKTQLSTDAVQSVLKDVYTSIANQTKTDNTLIETIAKQAGVSTQNAQVMVNSLSALSFDAVPTTLAQNSGMSVEQMQSTFSTLVKIISQDKTIIEKLSKRYNIPQDKVMQLMQLVPSVATQAPIQMIEHLAHDTSLNASIVSQILKDMLAEIRTGTKESIIQKVSSSEHVQTEKMRDIILTILDKDKRKRTARIPAQMPMGALIDVDDLISEEDSLSVDEYEEIKQMWINHYLHGEIPISETIKTREDWVHKDIIDIENVLNKIVSDDEDVRAEGLQQVADIIPFFMLANMSVTDVAVYLKAKRAAAKEVSEMMGRESAVKARLQAQSQEEFVEVDRTQTEAIPQEQTMSRAMPIEEEKSK